MLTVYILDLMFLVKKIIYIGMLTVYVFGSYVPCKNILKQGCKPFMSLDLMYHV